MWNIIYKFFLSNGLKEVNDFLGHDAGDELILSIVNGIKINIRDNDFVCRLGGDEFLIIFQDIDEMEAEKVWLRINEEYRKINDTQNRQYVISASHGIEEFKFNSNEFIDTIINHADEKMYIEKQIIDKGTFPLSFPCTIYIDNEYKDSIIE